MYHNISFEIVHLIIKIYIYFVKLNIRVDNICAKGSVQSVNNQSTTNLCPALFVINYHSFRLFSKILLWILNAEADFSYLSLSFLSNYISTYFSESKHLNHVFANKKFGNVAFLCLLKQINQISIQVVLQFSTIFII